MRARVHPKKPHRSTWRRRLDLTRHRAHRLDNNVKGLLWSVAAGLCFVLLNTTTRYLTTQLPPMQSQFLRYLCGVLVLLPLVLRGGLAAWMPRDIKGQFVRGLVHTTALAIWFTAIPHISLSDTTAMGFTTPIFIMIGAWLFLREPMRWERWLAAGIGFAGVLIVVGPNLSVTGGWWNLVMLSTAPMFAASFLISKALTRYESAGVIVLWQSITVTLLSLPLALVVWQPVSATQWAGYVLCGLLGSGAHYLLMRSYAVADISATQSVKFLDLLWAAALGWLVFGDVPTSHSLIGGVIIAGSTLWIARRESRRA